MAQEKGGTGAARPDPAPAGKEARLAEALRANLRRRKAQSAARKDLSESGAGQNNDGASGNDGQIFDEQTRNDKP